MKVELHAATDVDQCVLFDPSAIPDWIRYDVLYKTVIDRLTELMTAGGLLAFRHESDVVDAALYIDESPPVDQLSLGYDADNESTLNVPSGTLWFIGVEDLPNSSPDVIDTHNYLPNCNFETGTSVSMNPGRYRAKIWTIRNEVANKLLHDRMSSRDMQLLSAHKKYEQRFSVIGTLLLTVGVILLSLEDHQILAEWARWGGLACLAAFALTTFYWRRTGKLGTEDEIRLARDRHDQFWENTPNAIIHLKWMTEPEGPVRLE